MNLFNVLVEQGIIEDLSKVEIRQMGAADWRRWGKLAATNFARWNNEVRLGLRPGEREYYYC
jgi:hypothetical protein